MIRRNASWLLAGLALLALQVLAMLPASATDKIKVVASFSILGDLVKQTGGERVEVVTLVGPDTDMHIFKPTPGDAKTLLGARLVVINGLGFEGWAERLIAASGFKGHVVIAAKGVKPMVARDGDGHAHGDGKTHAAQRDDPHAWQDVANVKIYIVNIRDALMAVDPAGAAHYAATASAYIARLDALAAELKSAFADIPKSRRRVIASHEAFTYFGEAHGVAFLAPRGVVGSGEASAQGVAALIRQIKREQAKVVFVENISNPRQIERIAKEAGARVGGTLYSDALSRPDGPASTYIDMMRHNARQILAAMK